jgi:acetyl-CoA carboxylase biotin carboxyl carrier protein
MNERDIRNLIRIVEETGIDELEIRNWWGRKIRVTRRLPAAVPTAGAAANALPPVAAAAAPVAAPAATPAPEAASAAPPAEADSRSWSEDTHHLIHSPIVGTFYRSPAPDAPPYIEVGDTIKAGQVVCIVEAMKLMNEIQAEQGGRVVEILVENATPVEYNQVMIVLEPES